MIDLVAVEIAHHGAKVESPLLAVEQHLAGLEHIPRQPPCKAKVERFEHFIVNRVIIKRRDETFLD
jgi:hypothetical protein